jgi:mannan endo-1,4-beta-mannosidase
VGVVSQQRRHRWRPGRGLLPGSAFVDALALDGYNAWGSWATPYQVMAPMYQRIIALHATAPVVVGEIASREANAEEQARGLSKAQWLSELFTETRLTRLTQVNYFHADKEFDWRLDSSPAALAAARKHLA